jgi:hypothetical protein
MTCVNFKRLSIALLAGLPLLNAACGGDNLTLPSEGQPASIEIQGDEQTAQVGSTLTLGALVKDSQGRPVQGATVDFALTEDRGGGHLDPASGTTGTDGTVSTTLTLGSQVGQTAGKASVAVGNGAAPIEATFTANGTGTGATTLAIQSGNEQQAPVNSELSAPLVVKVTDNFGNPVAGITVQWSAEGQGSVSDASTQTNDNGEASVTRTLGPNAGTQTTVATAEGLNGSPVTFTSTAQAGNASRIEIVSGNNQEAPAGTQLHDELVVRVLDENSNPVSGRAVAWVIGAGGGSVSPETSNTNGDGQASTHWTLGGSPGSNTVNAVVSGIGSVTFSAQGTGSGAPSNLAVTQQPPGQVTINSTISPAPVVQVRDAAGHDLAVPGVDVTAGLTGGRGQLAGTATVTTDANGRATFSDLKITGATGSYRLIFAADGYRSATSNKFDVVKAATTTDISGQGTSDPGQSVTFNFNVTSSAPGTPSGNVQIKASETEQCTAPAPQGSCQITFVTPGDRQVTATYSGDDFFASSSVTVTQHVNTPEPPPNSPPTANPETYTATSGQTLSVTDPANGVLANDTDPDPGTTLTAQIISNPSIGIVDLHSDGTFDYFPGIGASGTQDSFTYTASDGSLTSTPATVTINIQ